MNRRRFLKYAGTTAAVVGASGLAGYEFDRWQSSLATPSVSTTTVNRTVTGPTVTELVTTTETVTQNPIETGPIIVWESDFRNGTLDGFNPATVDESVSCTGYSNQQSDVFARVVNDVTAPSQYGKSLELIANPNKRKGIFVNSISARPAPYEVDKSWVAYGYVRNVGDSETISVNLNLVENFIGYHCIFVIKTNPYNPKFGMASIQVGNDLFDVLRLGNLHEWHYFEIEGIFGRDPEGRRIKRLKIDDTEHEMDYKMGRLPQKWQSSFQLNLEVTNMYTNCDLHNAYIGSARWCKVGLVRRP